MLQEGFRLAGFAALHAVREDAVLRAQTGVNVADGTTFKILARLALDLVPAVASQLVRGVIAVQESPFPIGNVHAIAHVVQQLFVEIGIRGRNLFGL
jgi:hypothetical protein